MEVVKLQPRYYTVKQIQQLENCGRDKAYEIAKKLPHETRGRALYVFSEDYDNYYKNKRKNVINGQQNSNVYELQKFRY